MLQQNARRFQMAKQRECYFVDVEEVLRRHAAGMGLLTPAPAAPAADVAAGLTAADTRQAPPPPPPPPGQ